MLVVVLGQLVEQFPHLSHIFIVDVELRVRVFDLDWEPPLRLHFGALAGVRELHGEHVPRSFQALGLLVVHFLKVEAEVGFVLS